MIYQIAVAALLITAGSSYAQNTTLLAQIDPEIAKQCKDARDFVGCVKAFSTPPEPKDDGLSSLRSAMKMVSGRISSGFSLRDSTLFFQPVVDQLALVAGAYPESLAVTSAKKASDLFDVVQRSWQSRINTLSVGTYTGTLYSCKPTEIGVKDFNAVAGREVVTYSVRGGLFGLTVGCQESVGVRHEALMLAYIRRVLDDGSISPEEIAQREKEKQEREARLQREKELCAMGPWNRYLEENPAMRTWAAANPVAAEAQKKKFLANPKNQASCSQSSYFQKNDWSYGSSQFLPTK